MNVMPHSNCRLPNKLREGSVFSHVYLSVSHSHHGGGGKVLMRPLSMMYWTSCTGPTLYRVLCPATPPPAHTPAGGQDWIPVQSYSLEDLTVQAPTDADIWWLAMYSGRVGCMHRTGMLSTFLQQDQIVHFELKFV